MSRAFRSQRAPPPTGLPHLPVDGAAHDRGLLPCSRPVQIRVFSAASPPTSELYRLLLPRSFRVLHPPLCRRPCGAARGCGSAHYGYLSCHSALGPQDGARDMGLLPAGRLIRDARRAGTGRRTHASQRGCTCIDRRGRPGTRSPSSSSSAPRQGDGGRASAARGCGGEGLPALFPLSPLRPRRVGHICCPRRWRQSYLLWAEGGTYHTLSPPPPDREVEGALLLHVDVEGRGCRRSSLFLLFGPVVSDISAAHGDGGSRTSSGQRAVHTTSGRRELRGVLCRAGMLRWPEM
ncbi:hypothetical protein C8J57DRAFT_498465 [Mycena rebaudengoi]|nr:hypothetical protein C8J57DRAFT_498465 [Mycena rebaudengoi]